jgi:hypothetical protein
MTSFFNRAIALLPELSFTRRKREQEEDKEYPSPS